MQPDANLADKLLAHRLRWRARVRRALRHLPRRSNIRRYPVIRRFARFTTARPELWSYRAPYTTRAAYLGGVITFLPLGGVQILLVFALCLLFRANLTIAAALQFLSNPLTAAPMYVGSYQLGKLLLGWAGLQPDGWLTGAAGYLTVGGIVAGLALGAFIDLTTRFVVATNHRRQRQLAVLASLQDTP